MADPCKESIHIIIIDSHNLVRSGLSLILQKEPDMIMVGDAGNSNDALRLIAEKKPDIILLKLDPEGDMSLDLIPRLLSTWHHGRIILLVRREESGICIKAVEEGVLGIVFKTVTAEVLYKAIRKVHSGEVWIEHSILASLLSGISRAKLGLSNNQDAQRIAQLSNRERGVIRLIGQGYKNKQIAENLCISETTVRHHLTSVYGKLGVTDRLELLIYANRNKLV